LPRRAGGEMANLPPLAGSAQVARGEDPEDLRKDFTVIDTASGPALFCDLSNPSSPATIASSE